MPCAVASDRPASATRWLLPRTGFPGVLLMSEWPQVTAGGRPRFLATYRIRPDLPFRRSYTRRIGRKQAVWNGLPGRRKWEVKAMTDLWSWRDTARSHTTDLVGFQVVATDGAIGNLDAATYDVGGSYIVVDTGFWIFGKKRMLPAGVIDRIDYDDRKVYINLTKDEIRQAPDYDAEREREEAYRQDVGTYYGPYFRS